MSTTLLQLTDEFYNIVNEPTTSNVFPTAWVENLLNNIQQDICRQYKFPFLFSKYLFDTAMNTTLSSAVTAGDTTINLATTSGFATAGAVWIDHDIVNYTGKTGTTITGCTNVDLGHNGGVKVEPMYALPTNFGHSPEVFVGIASNTPLREYHYIIPEEFDITDLYYRWTIEPDKNGVEYIRIRNPESLEPAVFSYYKVPATMTSVVNCTIPDQFATNVLPRIAAGVAKIIRDDDVDNIGSVISKVGQSDLLSMKNYYMRRLGIESLYQSSKYKSRPRFSKRYKTRVI